MPQPLLLRWRDLGSFDAPPRPEPPRGLPRGVRVGLSPVSAAVRVVTAERVLGLSYDDGPHPEATPAVLAELAQRGVRATFFVLATKAEAHPDLVRRMLAEGHEVGLHGLDHTRLTGVPARRAAGAVRAGFDRLAAITGRPPALYRPAYGALGVAQHLAARRLGMDVVLWSAWARDWLDDPAETVADRALGARHPGAILLLHEATDDAEALAHGTVPRFDRGEVTARVLDGLAADGYTVLPVGALLARCRALRVVAVRRPGAPGTVPW